MNIDLVYYFREVNHYYYLNGPEKVNGNIVNNSPAYQLSSANDVVSKINQMIASLAPDVTNVGLVSSELYTGDIQVNTYRGELNVSSSSDYTNILTAINTNLTNLNTNINSNFSNLNESFKLPFNAVFEEKTIMYFGFIYVYFNHFDYCYLNRNGAYIVISVPHTYATMQDIINNKSSIANDYKNRIPVETGFKRISSFYSVNYNINPNSQSIDYTVLVLTGCNFVYDDLVNFSDSKNISEILNERDNVLIVDGQQEFKLHKDDE